MVDPNRKINRLTDKDIEFLDECEEEFANRFTTDDEDFAQHCCKTLDDPPIVENWGFGGGQFNNRGGGGGGGGQFNNRGGGGGGGYRNSSNNRGGNRHGNYHGNFRGNRNNYRRNRPPYDARDRNDRRRFNDDRGSDNGNRPPMNVRRDYGNFVAASKD